MINSNEVAATINRMHKGIALSDHEIRNAIQFLEPHVDFLMRIGDKYALTYRSLYEDLTTLKSFIEHRKKYD